MQQLGRPFYEKLGLDAEEMLAIEPKRLGESAPLRLLRTHLRDGVPTGAIGDVALRADVERAAILDRNLAETGEVEALLAGLAGRFVRPGPGGDPVRNPDVPSGRNLFPFEADKIPTRSAFETGAAAFAQLVEMHRASHEGAAPTKLAFSLWSSETMRHLGILEAQVLHALGLRPVWDAGGRVVSLDIVPAAELGRPRIDVVVQATGLYRDQFDGFMRLLAGAIERLSALDEPGNAIASNSRAVAARLVVSGRSAEDARRLAAVRIFSNEPGDYGAGLSGAALDSTSWDKDATLADGFLSRMKFAYGVGLWGADAGETNLFAEQLRGTDGAVLSRSSNTHGVLSTDHPFEYLGGLSLAVRRLGGASPSLYVADLRQPRSRIGAASTFLADELRTRTLNPQWIAGMQREGYAGTLEILNQVNNLFGWQVTDPSMVRADQWQAVHDTFVRDSRALGLAKWFEAHNPTAQAQVLDRMVEAIRKGYWDAPDATRQEIASRWRELAAMGAEAGAAATRAFVEAMAAGFGEAALAGAAGGETQSPAATAGSALEAVVSGPVMRKVEPEAQQPPAAPWAPLLATLALALCGLAGAIREFAVNRRRYQLGAAA